jgi:hypothetical protein
MGFASRIARVLMKKRSKEERSSATTVVREPLCTELVRRSSSMERILQDPFIYDQVLRFSESEFCSENFELWQQLRRYRLEKNAAARLDLAERIWKIYLARNAPKEVNVSGVSRSIVEERITNGQCDQKLFISVMMDVETLMADVYLRYSLTKKI